MKPFLFLLLMSCFGLFAQRVPPAFYRPIGFGGSGFYSYVRDIVVDQDDNVYVGGYFDENLCILDTCLWMKGEVWQGGINTDIFLMKFDSARQLQWIRQYGGKGVDHLNDMELTPEGDLLIAGGFSDTADFGDTLINPSVPFWPTFNPEEAFWGRVSPEGEMKEIHVIRGNGLAYPSNIELDTMGNVWLELLEGSDTAYFDGNKVAKDTALYSQILFIRYDKKGGVSSYKSFPARSKEFTERKTTALQNGELIIATNYRDLPFRLMKLDTLAQVVKIEPFKGRINDLIASKDNQFLVLASVEDTMIWKSDTLLPGHLLMKLDSQWNILWKYNRQLAGVPTFVKVVVREDVVYVNGIFGVGIEIDGIYYPASSTREKDLITIQHNLLDGSINWVKVYGDPVALDLPHALAVDSRYRVIQAAGFNINVTTIDSFFVPNPLYPVSLHYNWIGWTEPDTGLITSINNLQTWTRHNQFQVFPNPTTQVLWLQVPEWLGAYVVSILDIHGQLCYQKTQVSSKERLEMSINGYKPGIYVWQVMATNGETYQGKFVVTAD